MKLPPKTVRKIIAGWWFTVWLPSEKQLPEFIKSIFNKILVNMWFISSQLLGRDDHRKLIFHGETLKMDKNFSCLSHLVLYLFRTASCDTKDGFNSLNSQGKILRQLPLLSAFLYNCWFILHQIKIACFMLRFSFFKKFCQSNCLLKLKLFLEWTFVPNVSQI